MQWQLTRAPTGQRVVVKSVQVKAIETFSIKIFSINTQPDLINPPQMGWSSK